MKDDVSHRRTFAITAFAGLALAAPASNASRSIGSDAAAPGTGSAVPPGDHAPAGTIGQRMGGGGTTMRRIPNRRSRITVAVQSVAGGLNNATVRGVLNRHIADVRRCYEEGVAEDLGLHGHVDVRFVIGSSGSVMGSEIIDDSLHSDRVTTCMTETIRSWTFPSPGEGALVTAIARYELAFR